MLLRQAAIQPLEGDGQAGRHGPSPSRISRQVPERERMVNTVTQQGRRRHRHTTQLPAPDRYLPLATIAHEVASPPHQGECAVEPLNPTSHPEVDPGHRHPVSHERNSASGVVVNKTGGAFVWVRRQAHPRQPTERRPNNVFVLRVTWTTVFWVVTGAPVTSSLTTLARRQCSRAPGTRRSTR